MSTLAGKMVLMEIVEVETVSEWRSWLARNHASHPEVWLVLHHKSSSTPSPRYHEAVEQALCFGWIDGLHRSRDADSSQLRFTPRRAGSVWSALNRERASAMIRTGQMTEQGQALVDRAKADGTWEIDTRLPDDLVAALDLNTLARNNFDAFPPSSRRLILLWIAAAKRADTRSRRISETVDLAAQNIRANHPKSRRSATMAG